MTGIAAEGRTQQVTVIAYLAVLYVCRAVFAFSTELLKAADSQQQQQQQLEAGAASSEKPAGSYILQPTGRYAHSPAYLRQVAAATGWQAVLLQEAQIRQNAGQPIWGTLCILQRQHITL
jgi:predicted TPR repeat methyltransferase